MSYLALRRVPAEAVYHDPPYSDANPMPEHVVRYENRFGGFDYIMRRPGWPATNLPSVGPMWVVFERPQNVLLLVPEAFDRLFFCSKPENIEEP